VQLLTLTIDQQSKYIHDISYWWTFSQTCAKPHSITSMKCPTIIFHKWCNLLWPCFIKKLDNELTSNFLSNWTKLQLKRSSVMCSIWRKHLIKSSCVWKVQEVFRRERGCGRWQTTWLTGNNKNRWKYREGEEDRSLFRHQNNDRRVEYGQRNSETNLNIKKCVPKWSQRNSQFLDRKQIPMLKHAPYSPDVAPYDFFFSKYWKVHTKKPIFSQLKTSIRKQWLLKALS